MKHSSLKAKLKKQVWEKPDYYYGSRKEIRKIFFGNPALVKLLEYSHKGGSILDCGCGDGRIIEILWRKEANFRGFDISERAIKLAKKRLKSKKNVDLKVGDIEKINFPDETFDMVYTTYTLEHLNKPEKVIEEMVRVTKKGGYLILISPNYGSPFHPSGSSLPSGESLLSRAVKIFLKSHLYLLKKPNNLAWVKVEPKVLKEGKWQSDWDTIIEPSLQTLLIFLKKKGVAMIENSSGITTNNLKIGVSLRQKILSIVRRIFEFLGNQGVPPYKYFGPTLMVVGRKK